jgi:hypothetical protein
MDQKTRDAIAEAGEFLAACGGLGDDREVRLQAGSASDFTVMTLGTVRRLTDIARLVRDLAEVINDRD